MKVSGYHESLTKRLLDLSVSIPVILITLPLTIFIGILIKVSSKGGMFFLQKRTGKNGNVFRIIKFRTMVKAADKLKIKYKRLNESDGPVFKIQNDPRFTRFGKILSKTGLDELPQFINVFLGHMSVVGPRPLPIYESAMLSKDEKARELVKPGITSSWVTHGQHSIPFKRWMKLDKIYVENGSLKEDTIIIVDTFFLMVKIIGKQFQSIVNY